MFQTTNQIWFNQEHVVAQWGLLKKINPPSIDRWLIGISNLNFHTSKGIEGGTL